MLIAEGGAREIVLGVVSGLLRCFRMTPDGRRHVTRFVRPGNLVGLWRLALSRSSVEAVAISTIAEFRAEALDAASACNEAIREAAFQALTGELTARDRAQFRLGRLWAEERVADFLLEVAEVTSGAAEGELRMSRIDIADHLGMTIETVSRALRCFQKDSVIRLEDARHFRILRPRTLQALALGDSEGVVWRNAHRAHSLH
jgi:CRP-like cAMP-binding protein